jgi:Family of unknown function (DUF5872)
MPTPNDKDLYEKIKKEITSKYKPSAYRSGIIVQKYKVKIIKNTKIIMHIVVIRQIQI